MSQNVRDDQVITLHYTLLVDGEELENTREGKPIRFIQGAGQILPGLENALYGLQKGEQKTIPLPPEDAYGDYDPGSIEVVKKQEFSEEIPLDVGTFLDLRDDEGDVLSAQIIEAEEDTVTLDFNHPLAGKTLTFTVDVVDIRPATASELEHGHVH